MSNAYNVQTKIPSTVLTVYQPSQSSSECPRLVQQSAPNIPPSSALGSTDHFFSARHFRSLSQPRSYISIPVQAIMAALSVQSSMGGKESLRLGNPRAARNERKLSAGKSLACILGIDQTVAHTQSLGNHCLRRRH